MRPASYQDLNKLSANALGEIINVMDLGMKTAGESDLFTDIISQVN